MVIDHQYDPFGQRTVRGLYYLKLSDGETQIWRSRWDGTTQERVTNSRRNVLAATYARESPSPFKFSGDGKEILFQVAKDASEVKRELERESHAGYFYDDRFRADKSARPFIRNCGLNSRGKGVEVSISRACTPQLRIHHILEKTERLATQSEIDFYHATKIARPKFLEKRDIRMLRASEDQNNWAWLENVDPRKFPGRAAPRRLYAFSNETQYSCPHEVCTAYGGIVENIWIHSDSHEVIFQRADGANKEYDGSLFLGARYRKR